MQAVLNAQREAASKRRRIKAERRGAQVTTVPLASILSATRNSLQPNAPFPHLSEAHS
jgi:hypothetical protein